MGTKQSFEANKVCSPVMEYFTKIFNKTSGLSKMLIKSSTLTEIKAPEMSRTRDADIVFHHSPVEERARTLEDVRKRRASGQQIYSSS